MRTVKGRDHTILLESDPRPLPLDSPTTDGKEQRLDPVPFKGPRDWIAEDHGKGFALR